jgi:hypothetical protein
MGQILSSKSDSWNNDARRPGLRRWRDDTRPGSRLPVSANEFPAVSFKKNATRTAWHFVLGCGYPQWLISGVRRG